MSTFLNFKCHRCGTMFHRKPSYAKKAKTFYCSKKCRVTSRIVKCAYCGKDLKRLGVRIKGKNYCNANHQMKYEYAHGRERKPHPNLYIAHKEKCSGDNYYNWQGGAKTATEARMNDTAWHKLRKVIYARDKWVCQICGASKIKVHCHHIVPYRVTQDNSPENLVTLCAKCHTTEEQKYLHSLKGQLEFNFGYQA